MALVFLYTAQGIPCLYYGTEQAFNGGKDPFDREDMFAGQFEWGPSRGDNFNMTHPLFQLVARLNNFRRLYPALQTGVQSNLWSNANGPGLFAYARRLGAQQVFVVFNTAETNQNLPPCPTIYPPGTKLQNLLDEKENLTVLAGGQTPPRRRAGHVRKYLRRRIRNPSARSGGDRHIAGARRKGNCADRRRWSFTSASRWTPAVLSARFRRCQR